jgi:predicted  nucleic acid-binding Zn-ribbon protein
VSSTDNEIQSGKYDSKYEARSSHPTISSLFLQLIGIDSEHNIIRNKDFITDRLTWRKFLHTFLIQEEEITKKESILLPQRKEANTLLMSTLIFLMTGQDFAGFDKREEKKIRDAKKTAIIKRIYTEIEDLSRRKDKLETQMEQYKDIGLEEQVHSIINEVSALKERIEQANERGKQLLGEIMVMRTELADCDLLANRYSALREHFVSDIKRLTLIVDGEAAFESAPILEKCPLCDHEIESAAHPHYLEAARSELTRLIRELEGLSDAERDTTERRSRIETELSNLTAEKSDIDELIKQKLKPQESMLSAILNDYRAAAKVQGELDFIHRITGERTAELREAETAEESKLEFLPREHFDSSFRETIDKYLLEIFTQCRYEGFLTSHFDVKTRFDTSVNGKNKATTSGQGYRAFINTVTALAFRKYLLVHGKYKPEVFYVDSPLQTLKQGVNDQAPESMRTAFFRYLLETQEDGQVLVIENEIPEMNYANYGVNPIYFTGGKTPGRYGFLYIDGQF